MAIPTPVKNFFDYLSPKGGEGASVPEVCVGGRVKVPFGQRQLVGVVIEVGVEADCDISRLKAVTEVLDTEPVVGSEMLDFVSRAARYYHYPLGEAISTALPAALRAGVAADSTDETLWRACGETPAADLQELARAKAQAACYEWLRLRPGAATEPDLRKAFKSWRSLLLALAEKGLVEQQGEFEAEAPSTPAPAEGLALNAEQASAVESVRGAADRFGVFLLEGITGSGKTEVYLSMMAAAMEAGRQVLILVPEIGLTPQFRERLEQRFHQPVHCIHSGLNKKDRLHAWRQAQKGRASIVLGTRSAVFTPLPKLGMIIVDEEHDGSFKQQEGFRYHARDLAVMRGQVADVPVVLGTATPSLESLYHATEGRYRHLRLKRRAGGATPPSFRVVDLRQQPIEEGISQALHEHIQRHLLAGNQVLLFVNRRGYSPVLLCHDCGATLQCPHCDSNATFHAASHSLRCHHCGYVARAPDKCPECSSTELVNVGVGTERLEEALKQRYPDYSTVRIDRDTMSRKGRLEATLEEIREGRHRIIVGTQMLAKGHDFPTITLVGIVDVDQGLFSSELRAQERLAQQILQVGGRAGRGNLEGEVVLQTHQPGHPALQSLLKGGYNEFAQNLLQERAVAQFPPYGYLTLIRASARDADTASGFLEEVASLAKQGLVPGVHVLGPVASGMERRAGRYHHQLLLMSPERPALHKLLNYLQPQTAALKSARKVRWSIDVDPMDSI